MSEHQYGAGKAGHRRCERCGFDEEICEEFECSGVDGEVGDTHEHIAWQAAIEGGGLDDLHGGGAARRLIAGDATPPPGTAKCRFCYRALEPPDLVVAERDDARAENARLTSEVERLRDAIEEHHAQVLMAAKNDYDLNEADEALWEALREAAPDEPSGPES